MQTKRGEMDVKRRWENAEENGEGGENLRSKSARKTS